jgi:hypothetical protein
MDKDGLSPGNAVSDYPTIPTEQPTMLSIVDLIYPIVNARMERYCHLYIPQGIDRLSSRVDNEVSRDYPLSSGQGNKQDRNIDMHKEAI